MSRLDSLESKLADLEYHLKEAKKRKESIDLYSDLTNKVIDGLQTDIKKTMDLIKENQYEK